jgi:hypothetical protein
MKNQVTFHNRPGRPDKYDRIGPSVALSLKVPIEMKQALRELADSRSVSVHGLVRNAIASYINFLYEQDEKSS